MDMIWRIGNKEIKGKRYVEGPFRTDRISVDINAHMTSLQEIFLAEETLNNYVNMRISDQLCDY